MNIPALLLLCTLVTPVAAQTLGSWERIDHPTEMHLWDVDCADSLSCIAVGDFGVMLFSTDGGESWKQRLSENQFALRNVHFFDDSLVIVAGFRGSCYRSTDGGGNWTAVALPTAVTLPGMSVVGHSIWLSGDGGTIVTSSDRGLSWRTLNSGTDRLLEAISFADQQHGWASSSQRVLLRTTDGGEHWQEQQIDAFLPVRTIHARSADECWAAGYRGLLLRTLDGGTTWQRIDAYETDYVSLTFDDKGTGWAVGKRGAIVRGEDDNLRWRLHDLTGTGALNAITFLPNNQALSVGMHGMILKLYERIPSPPDTGSPEYRQNNEQ